jgi:hypothetical protein
MYYLLPYFLNLYLFSLVVLNYSFIGLRGNIVLLVTINLLYNMAHG